MNAPRGTRVAILGAAGAVGGLFARSLSEAGLRVSGIDLREPRDPAPFEQFALEDATSKDARATEILGESDWVLLCLPEEPAIRAALALPFPSSIELLVDTLSVKTPIVKRLSGAKLPCEHVSINPMFAPSLGFGGQAVAVVRQGDDRGGSMFLGLIERWGSRLCEMSAEDHDRVCATTQAATHAALIALASVAAGASAARDLLSIAPPPHLVCLSLAARIAAAAPETYWDIQRHNPHAAALRRRLIDALTELDGAVERGDYAAFARTIEGIGRFLGPDLDRLGAAAAGAIRGASEALPGKDRGRGPEIT